MRARELEGTKRDEAMKRFEEIDRAYRTYQERTERLLPVVLLERMS